MIENQEVRIEEEEIQEGEVQKETTQFPWAVAIVIGVLALLIIACFIAIWVLEH